LAKGCQGSFSPGARYTGNSISVCASIQSRKPLGGRSLAREPLDGPLVDRDFLVRSDVDA
jgi:hypothetical protein